MNLRALRRGICNALFCVALVAANTANADTVIDDFSTNQSALTLTYPPAGTSASSSVSGGGILGGERDLQISLTSGVIAGNTESATVSSGFFSYSQDATIGGNAVLQWDGADGSSALNATGLGGVDLTGGGVQDALAIDVFFDDLPIAVTLTAYTDAGNASTASITLPGLIFSSTRFSVPFSAFTTTLGAGATFSNIGAFTMTTGSTVTAPDLVIDRIAAVSTLAATQTLALFHDVNGDAVVDPGDTLRYTLIVTNPADGNGASATGVTATVPIPVGGTLVVGSVTTTQGTVTSGNTAGDGSVGVNIGTLADGGTTTITYDVLLGQPASAPATFSTQATIASSSLTALLSDDPTVGGTADPTSIAVASPAVLSATNTVAGSFLPGGSVTYTIVISNTGVGTQFDNPGDEFADVLPSTLTLVSATATSGTPVANIGTNTVTWDGSIARFGTVTIIVTAKINASAAGQSISNQGTLHFDADGDGTNESTAFTDDPTQVGVSNPTTFAVQSTAVPAPTLSAGWLILLGTLLVATVLVVQPKRLVGIREKR